MCGLVSCLEAPSLYALFIVASIRVGREHVRVNAVNYADSAVYRGVLAVVQLVLRRAERSQAVYGGEYRIGTDVKGSEGLSVLFLGRDCRAVRGVIASRR